MTHHYFDIIRQNVITEKSMNAGAQNKYTFKVDPDSNKADIKKAVEHIYGVNVEKVNILNRKPKVKVFKGKKGTRAGSKIAIVTLKEGSFVDFSQEVA